MIDIEFVAADADVGADGIIAVPAFAGTLGPAATALDERLSGALTRAVGASRFKGEPGQTLDVLAPAGLEAGRVLLVGVGPLDKVDAQAVETGAAHAYQAAKAAGPRSS